MDDIFIEIICSNGDMFWVTSSVRSTVVEFKDLLAKISGVPANAQSLTYKGMILEDDEPLDTYGLQENHAIYMEVAQNPLVAGTTKTTPPSNATTGGWSDHTKGIPDTSLVTPAISMTMQSLLSNSEYMKQIIHQNSQLRSMFDSNPQLRDWMQPGVVPRLTSPQMMQGTQRVRVLAITDNAVLPENEFSTAMSLMVKDTVNISQSIITQASLLRYLPMVASSTDFVVSISKSSIFPGGKFFEEFLRVLKPGGEIFIHQTSAEAKETTQAFCGELLYAGFSDIQVVQMAEIQSFGIKAKKPMLEHGSSFSFKEQVKSLLKKPQLPPVKKLGMDQLKNPRSANGSNSFRDTIASEDAAADTSTSFSAMLFFPFIRIMRSSNLNYELFGGGILAACILAWRIYRS